MRNGGDVGNSRGREVRKQKDTGDGLEERADRMGAQDSSDSL